MAEGINVGSVEVSVVPDARQFNPLLQAQITPAADEAARKISDAISQGIRDGLSDPASTAPAREQGTRAGDTFGTAFKNRVKAALSALPSAEVTLEDSAAQAKLDYLREELTSLSGQRIGVDISDTEAIARLTALRAEMDNLADRSASVQVKVDTAAASAQLDKFFAETTVKAQATGDKVGKDLTDSATKSASMGSPLIMGAVAAGLIAGGPAVSAAGVLVFGGLAAMIVSNVGSVQDAFHGLKTNVLNDVQGMGQEIAPTFVAIAADAQQAFNQVEPAIHDALVAVAPEVRSIAQGFESAAETAIPAFTRAIQNGQPIVSGLNTLLRDIGSGVAGLMDALTAHSGAEGGVLSGLGGTINTLLPMIGTLLGEGAELGAQILPPINTALRLVAGALDIIAPVLPAVVTGFLAFKAVQGVESLLNGIGNGLLKIASSLPDGALSGRISGLGGALGGVAKEAESATALSAAMGPLAIGVGVVTAALPALVNWLSQTNNVIPKTTVDTQGLNAALQQSKGAIDSNVTSAAALALQQGGLFKAASQWGVSASTLTQAVLGNRDAMDQVQAAAGRYKSTQDAAAGSMSNGSMQAGIAGDAYKRAGMQSDEWLGAIKRLAGGTDSQIQSQKDLATAVEGASSTEQTNATRLQGISSAAGSANSQINLLKGALDALTGQQVSMVQAQDAVIQATDAAVAAAKNQTGALVQNNDVMGTNTARAAASREALIQVANSSNTLISTMEQQGKTSAEVNAKDAELRASFIKTAEQMGYSSGQAQDLANKIYGIPASRTTEINADTDIAKKRLQDLQNDIDAMRGKNIQITVSAQGGLATYTTDQRNLLYSGKADGGPISGPGTGTSDTAGLFALSNGEHVWTAAEVAAAGGHGAVESIRQAVLAGGGGKAAGGPIVVKVNLDETRVDTAVDALKKQMAASLAPGAPGNVSANAQLGQLMAGRYGWGSGAEWNSLYALWKRESGWNNNAQNPTSTAYGIPQFLNGTWASTGYPKSSDAAVQIAAGLKYIDQRFHDPIGAWAHETKYGWYDAGGLLPTGPSLVYNGTGAPELIAPKQTFEQVMSGASGGSGPATFTGNLYLDSGEFLGKVRGVAQEEAAGVVASVRNALTY